jgi:type IV secretory pathway TrbD component
MKSRPWLWIIFGLALFFAAWITLVIIAHRANPLYVPLKHLSSEVPTKESDMPAESAP